MEHDFILEGMAVGWRFIGIGPLKKRSFFMGWKISQWAPKIWPRILRFKRLKKLTKTKWIRIETMVGKRKINAIARKRG